ncbi:unnamed protein product, partial [marine sediment metagenome]
AALTTDYTIETSPVVITAGSTTTTITITVINNNTYEGDETVIVDMGVPTNSDKGATSQHTLTITDEGDRATVQFTASTQSGTEDTAGTLTITCQLSDAADVDVTIPYTVNGSSTAALTTDYTIEASPVVITAGT